jgi:DNA-binding MarR family transcriptional regulator
MTDTTAAGGLNDASGKTDSSYDMLRLENQLCFPLYACSREIVKKYKPFLDELDLTYTQYITMMVMWERKQMNVKELGECLYLDSGTLTPLLKKLEQKGWVSRARAREDERVLIVTLTPEGAKLRDRALDVPVQMSACVPLKPEEASALYKLLYKILDNGCCHGSPQP